MRIRGFSTMFSRRFFSQGFTRKSVRISCRFFRWTMGLCLMLLLYPFIVQEARASAFAPKGTEPNILVVYSTESGEITESVRMLDLLLGHFSPDLTFLSDQDLSSMDLQDRTHVVYYGATERELSSEAQRILVGYEGPLLAIGKNIEQLGERFSYLTVQEKVAIHGVSKPSATETQSLPSIYFIPRITLDGGNVLLQGWKGQHAYPLYMAKEQSYYFATDDLFEPFSFFLGEGLYSFFQESPSSEHLAYIRLEDVHPFSDPILVQETGDYLADQGIPFMIALIPIYTNPETLQQYHLKEMPELVQVLQHLQERGASILLHGYTHQYRQSETGEGFEFWDVENNTPTYAPPDQEVEYKERHEFSTLEEYNNYIEELKTFERNYTRTRIEQGIFELAELDLYPLGFEPPHYTMSQEGYRVTADYFNFFVGQVQLGDNDWEIMSSAPYITDPAFLHGMTLFPETLGYFDPESATPLEDFMQNVKRMQEVEGSVLSLFYHPYLGLENLKQMIAHIETIPQVSWIDLKALDVQVTAPSLTILRDEDGLHIEKYAPKRTLIERIEEFRKTWGLQAILWGIVVVVAIMVGLFLIYTLFIRMGLRKQLFEEKRADG